MADPPEISGGNFAPRSSLARTPPSATGSPAPPAPGPSSAKRPLSSPGESQPPKPTRRPTLAPLVVNSGGKRQIAAPAWVIASEPATPDTDSEITPLTPLTEAPVRAAPLTTPAVPQTCPLGLELQTSKVSKLEMLDVVRASLKKIIGIVSGPGSKLNKTDVGSVYGCTQDVLSIVSALELQLSETERRADLAEAKLASTRAQDSMGAAAARPVGTAMSFAQALKTGKGSALRPVKAGAGPVLAFYPKEEAESNTSEGTKAELKKHVDPDALSVQIEKVRRIGNAGVVVHTASVESAERLKKAVPVSLRVVEPRRRLPLVAIRDVEGNPDFEALVEQIHKHTFVDDPEWTLEALQKNMKGLFKRGRRNSQFKETTVVFECSPRLREVLIGRESVCLRWQRAEVYDYINVTCCNKCQQYGHPEKFCRSQEVTCSRCGETGHRADKCAATFSCCATCKRFKRDSAHRTASQDCPARKHAEELFIQQIQYG